MKWPFFFVVLAFSSGNVGGIKVHVQSAQSHVSAFNSSIVVIGQSAKFSDLRDWAEPEGGRIVENAQNVTYGAVSSVPRGLQFFWTILWVLMIGGLPLYLRMLSNDSERPTKFTTTEITLSVALWTTLFGGLGLFTNIILFQSAHFAEVRPLTMIECIYLMSQVMTTVGYGDITPAKLRGQVFVAFYILGAIFIICLMVSEMMEHVSKKTKAYEKDLQMKIQKSLKRGQESGKDESAEDALHHLFGKPKAPDTAPLIQSILRFLVVDVVFVAFYVFWPGEDKTVGQAIYMSIVTFSSVGFGAFTPVTESGMIFNAFMMMFGSAALVSVITSFSELRMQTVSYERYDRTTLEDNLQKLEKNRWGAEDGGDNVTEAEFVMFGLVTQGLVSEEAIQSIQDTFKALKPHKDGCVDIMQIKEAVEEYEKSV